MNPLVLSSLVSRHPRLGIVLHEFYAGELITRLAHHPVERDGLSCPFTIRWTPQGAPTREVAGRFHWEDERVERLMAAEIGAGGVNENELTGRAAVAAAALLANELVGLVFERVTPLGDHGDYSVSGGASMIEISGIIDGENGDLTSRVTQKFTQVFKNPSIAYAFVSVTMFSDPRGDVVGVFGHRTRRDHEGRL
jgi:hypothetical protein